MILICLLVVVQIKSNVKLTHYSIPAHALIHWMNHHTESETPVLVQVKTATASAAVHAVPQPYVCSTLQ